MGFTIPKSGELRTDPTFIKGASRLADVQLQGVPLRGGQVVRAAEARQEGAPQGGGRRRSLKGKQGLPRKSFSRLDLVTRATFRHSIRNE